MAVFRRVLLGLPAAMLLLAVAPDPGIAVLERLFREKVAQAGWFTAQFIEKVPIDQVNTLLGAVRAQLGGLRSVSGSGHSFVVHLARGDVSARLVLTDDGKIAGLLLRPAASQGNLDDHVRAIAALPGETSVLVTRDGAVLAAKGAETPLAVGSAFKLAVLKAVAEAIGRQRLAWDQVARLEPAWRSLPSGSLQTWPDGTPLTIATLADMMISTSDNTAADALIALAGRAAVESLSPRNAPFLTTREAFVLKASAAPRSRWLAGDVAARRKILAEIAALPLPAPESVLAGLEIEWRFSARELAALLEALHAVPACAATLGINPGLASPAVWRRVMFKGGSELDCVNLSTLAVDHRGARHAVIVTWNGPGAAVEKLAGPYGGILQGLARGDG
jgi:hypothetical protein